MSEDCRQMLEGHVTNEVLGNIFLKFLVVILGNNICQESTKKKIHLSHPIQGLS